ncbi:hem peroxidase [Arabidopsis thaliana x Arabidopsis arenosa]|uniref:peroxidase n=1 Tax=Arabidopsis thaliana x Arabidopsis arenosa TaxID=1240361 RepID=A0A8T2BNS9_9BRAS|nr:hem peroxidase [Arabidopsis thaliana x Arabidopsis arenosa]
MAKAYPTRVLTFLMLISLMAVTLNLLSTAEAKKRRTDVPIVKGLSWNFYQKACPKVENIIKKELKKVFKRDIGLAAAILRIHFHDCFVQGCEASVLLAGSASGPGEQSSIPNLTLRQQAFVVINNLRALVQKKCGQVVSCSDILALAARDSVVLSGGPDYAVPLGRRDSLAFASQETTLNNLPPPFANASQLIADFASRNLNITDLVALSGGHTIGIAHCPSFTDRLYPNQDPTMNQFFANSLKRTCPTANSSNTQVNDIRSPDVFDNKYYVDLMNRQGLFTSDQDLFVDKRTRGIVESFAINQQLFFDHFTVAMIKMGQMSVLTGTQGEIRSNCSARNTQSFMSVLEEGIEEAVVSMI